MSKESLEWLNRNVLVGMASKRGNAWHYKQSAQGAEPNHYDGFIPAADVDRRLFVPAHAVSVPLFVPVLTADGFTTEYVPVPGRQAIMRETTGDVHGLFKDGYAIHQFSEWLIGVTSNILGDSLGITSAGLLKNGAVAWLEASVPDNVTTPEGVTFRPNILAGTSLDGTIATFYKRTITATVCDNTFEAARSESGQTYKVKHTRNSGLKLADARQALNLITEAADGFAEEVRTLCRTDVTDRQWDAFLSAYAPTVDATGKALEGRSLTMAENKQDTLRKLWVRDNRVSPWSGTAFGVVQAVNTFNHHEGIVRGTSRVERNLLNAIDGTTAQNDRDAREILTRVLATV